MFGIIVFPGSNCDHDCYHVVRHVMNKDAVFIWHKEGTLDESIKTVILPGGFSYGDYLRCGAIARFSPIMKAVRRFADNGGLLIGICNGFQILCEAGILPGVLMRNKGLRFICKNINIRVENNKTPFTTGYSQGQVVTIPIAHAEGNYYAPDTVIKELIDDNRIVFRYSGPNGEDDDKFNPNGAAYNIAGITNKEGNVLGMMPHPERCAEKMLGNIDGYPLFESIVTAV